MNNIHAYLVVLYLNVEPIMNSKLKSIFSPKFPYEFGAKDNSIFIDKKDYLIKESSSWSDEDSRLKKRAIDYRLK